MSYRVWVIGLDGATYDLILPWVAAGHLPTFGRLLREGAWGDVRSTFPPITGPAWSSFMTGTNPGRHGIFDWVRRRPGRYDFAPVTADHCRQPSLWRIAGEAGKRVLVLNVPMTFPPEPVNGLLVSGLPATALATHPEALANKIRTLTPDYILYPDPGQAYSPRGIDAFLSRLHLAIDRRLTVWRELRNREPWDFAMVVFNATDVVQHAMWRFMSPAHPRYAPDAPDRYRRAILDVYRALDRALENMLTEIDEDTVLWIMSDHGFGPLHHFIHVNTWLMREGLLTPGRAPIVRLKCALFRMGLAPMPIYDILTRMGFGHLKRKVVRGRGRGLMRALFLSFDDVDWSRTRAYSVGNIGQIRINLRGREPKGCVEPGEEYERVLTDIVDRLRRLRDPRSGEPAIEHIWRATEVYEGDAAAEGADILFLPRRLEYFGFGEYEFGDHRVIAPVSRGISGTHRMNGIGLAWGRPVRSGRFENARLEDLAPTILHLMGVPIPAHMDGRPLVEILRTDAGLPAPGRGPGWGGRDAGPTPALSQEEEQIILERLHNLGYVG